MEENKVPEKGEEGKAIEGNYMVDVDRGIAKIPGDVDSLGKMQLPKWVRQRLEIMKGAEVKVVLEVVRRYE